MKVTTLVFCIVLLLAFVTHGSAQNLENKGFESPSILNGAAVGTNPEPWFFFASTPDTQAGITDQKKRSGLQSYFFKGQKEADAFCGIAQPFNVLPGRRYEFSLYAINDASDPLAGETFGQISIEWKTETGEEIKRDFGPTWNFDLSPIRWEKFLVGANAPEGATIGQAVVTFFSRDAIGHGTCYIDETKVTQRIAPAK